MKNKKTEVESIDSDIESKLESAKEFMKRKCFKDARRLLLEIIRTDKKNNEARELIYQLERGRRIANFRVILITIFLITATGIAILGWTELPYTTISLQLMVNQFTFTLEEDWEIYDVEAKAIGISHLNNLELAPVRVEIATEYGLEKEEPIEWNIKEVQGDFQIKRSAEFWNILIRSNYLSLSSLAVDSGATVKLTISEPSSRKLIMNISNGSIFGTIETDTTLLLSCNHCEIGKYIDSGNSSSNSLRIQTQDREIDFRDLNSSIDIILEFPSKELRSKLYALGKSIAVQKVDFMRDEAGELESTIIGNGNIYFSELDEKEFDIKDGDFLEVEGLKNFQIKRLYLNNNIAVFLFGDVQKLRSGALLFSRMPTYLEWLHANNSIAIYIGTLIPVFSIILAIFYRLRIFDNLEEKMQ